MIQDLSLHVLMVQKDLHHYTDSVPCMQMICRSQTCVLHPSVRPSIKRKKTSAAQVDLTYIDFKLLSMKHRMSYGPCQWHIIYSFYSCSILHVKVFRITHYSLSSPQYVWTEVALDLCFFLTVLVMWYMSSLGIISYY